MKGIGCRDCGVCKDRKFCKPFRGKLRSYSGVRFTADGFDCALPVALDGHSTCSFRCEYCFANYLMRDPARKEAYSAGVDTAYKVGQFPLTQVEKLFSGDVSGTRWEVYNDALNEVGGKGTPRCPIQWGALGEPFDNIERQQGWGLEVMKLAEKYEQPLRISTKGADVVLEKEYQKAFSQHPELFWVAWSLISIDDKVLSMVDKDAPTASRRLKAMKSLSKLGVKNSLRMRPILPGISDRTAKYKHAWRDLLRASADAGAISISMEFTFVPGSRPPHVQRMWDEIERISGVPIVDWYTKTTGAWGACLRSSRAWKEDLTFAIYEEIKKLGMNFGCSDPHWKELNDFGCCCGIPPDDEFFGGWQRNNATHAVVRARQAHDKGKKLRVSAKDGIPKWAHKVPLTDMVCLAGPTKQYTVATKTWGDKLRDTWNDVKSPRGPLQYFEGCLVPVGKNKDGDVVYEYSEPERRDKSKKVPYLHV